MLFLWININFSLFSINPVFFWVVELLSSRMPPRGQILRFSTLLLMFLVNFLGSKPAQSLVFLTFYEKLRFGVFKSDFVKKVYKGKVVSLYL